ncbi:SCP-2 sterol transfer family protein [Micromonospora pallida]|uniref:SCP-2 sterol transfer family protein n=1 Tax=Micromonospora pallida TaxID=145854 RepID=A0A1C6SJC3_9ACTN|nr:SCP2 sterol-binding domain-containing protein [Micromonospora pallida]SCL29571.1 SCP-2 sterol transfer family protein [Micromonospora pallida]
MWDPTGEFFETVRKRGHEPLLEGAEGTIVFSLSQDHRTNHWFVEIRNGEVRVSREERGADCVVRTDQALFDDMVTGRERMRRAWLRNEVVVEGDLMLLARFERIFPGPPEARHPQAVCGREHRP